MERPKKLMSTARKLLFLGVVTLALTSAPLRAWAATYIQLAAGGAHTCGLTPNGEALCWGENNYGQSTPVAGPFTQLAAGGLHTCGLTPNGEALCWGLDYYGQSTPPPGPFTQLAAGGEHTCGLTPNGEALCWGRNGHGQATPPPGPFIQLAAGAGHTCGLTPNGEALCWGRNTSGESTPPPGPFTQLVAGGLHTCGLTPNGEALCWGWNIYGQSTPPPGPFTQLAAGWYHTCGLKPDGEALCWGSNIYGQATPLAGPFIQLVAGGGTGAMGADTHTCGLKPNGEALCWGLNYAGQSTPVAGPFTQLAASWDHTCGLKPDGEALCWGNNDFGKSTPPPGPFTQLTAGSEHTCGLKPNGEALCWGDNYFGQSTPVAGPFTQLAAGGLHTCGLKPNGEALCWGYNYYGQSTPPPGPFTQLTAGHGHTCGLKPNGEALCWGRNDYGQSTPPPGPFTQLAARGVHTWGLTPDGEALCWGSNVSGQSTPAAGPFAQLAAGANHTCGLKPNGEALCWGSNVSGQSTPAAGPFTQLAASGYYTCGLQTNGYVRCWGAIVIPGVDSEPDPDSDEVPSDDGDGVSDPCRGPFFSDCDDNCPAVFNPTQRDADGDGIGDLCDEETTEADCADGVDNDGDGDVDTEDLNCRPDAPTLQFSVKDSNGDTIATATSSDAFAAQGVALTSNESGGATITIAATGEMFGTWMLDGNSLATTAGSTPSWTGPLKPGDHWISLLKVLGDGFSVVANAAVKVAKRVKDCSPYSYPDVDISAPTVVADANSCGVRVVWSPAATNEPGRRVLYHYVYGDMLSLSQTNPFGPWSEKTEALVPLGARVLGLQAKYDCQPSPVTYKAVVLPSPLHKPIKKPEARPVIFLPGIYGSNLAKDPRGPENRRLYLRLLTMTDADGLDLGTNENGQSMRTDVEATSVLSVAYKPFLWFLKDHWPEGYVQPVPYDWRLNLSGANSATAAEAKVFKDLDCKLCDNSCTSNKPEYCNAGDGGPPKFDVVAHSMGGLVMEAYFRSRGDKAEQKIAHLITVGTPYLGAPKAIYTMLTGKEGPVTLWGLKETAFPEILLKRLATNTPSGYHLLPSPNYRRIFLHIGATRGPLADKSGWYHGGPPNAVSATYSFQEFVTLMTGSALPLGMTSGIIRRWGVLPAVRRFAYDLPQFNPHMREWSATAHTAPDTGWDSWAPKTIRLDAIYVTGRDTITSVEVTDSGDHPAGCLPLSDEVNPTVCDQPPLTLSDCIAACRSGYEVEPVKEAVGDGTVPAVSARGPASWKGLPNVHRWKLEKGGSMQDHGLLMSQRPDVRGLVYAILAKDCTPESTSPECVELLGCPTGAALGAPRSGEAARGSGTPAVRTTRQLPRTPRWRFVLRGAGNVQFTDDYGNITGDTAGQTIEELPDSSFIRTSAGRVIAELSDVRPLQVDIDGGETSADVTVEWAARRRLRRVGLYRELQLVSSRCQGGTDDGRPCQIEIQCGGAGSCVSGSYCQLLPSSSVPFGSLACDSDGNGTVDVNYSTEPDILVDLTGFSGIDSASGKTLDGRGVFWATGSDGVVRVASFDFSTHDPTSNRESRIQTRGALSYEYLGEGKAAISGRCVWVRDTSAPKNKLCKYRLVVDAGENNVTLFVQRSRGREKPLLASVGVVNRSGLQMTVVP